MNRLNSRDCYLWYTQPIHDWLNALYTLYWCKRGGGKSCRPCLLFNRYCVNCLFKNNLCIQKHNYILMPKSLAL